MNTTNQAIADAAKGQAASALMEMQERYNHAWSVGRQRASDDLLATYVNRPLDLLPHLLSITSGNGRELTTGYYSAQARLQTACVIMDVNWQRIDDTMRRVVVGVDAKPSELAYLSRMRKLVGMNTL